MTKEATRYVKDGLSRQKLFNALECIELLEKENEKLKIQVSYLGMKLFNLLSEYEIGNYDNNIHQFYKDVYAIHNELMELAE